MPGLSGIGILDSNLVYRADNIKQVIGFHSNQIISRDRKNSADDKVNFTYIPIEKSATKIPTILINRRIFSQNGNFMGAWVAAIYLNFAQDWIQTFPTGHNDVLAVMDQEGTLLARNPPMPDAIGKKINLWQGHVDTKMSLAGVGFTSESPIDGVQRIYGITQMDEVPIIIVVGYDLHTMLADWWRRTWQIAVGLVVLLGMSFIALWAYLKNIRQGEELLRLSTTDTLTGIANRRLLFETGDREILRIKRYKGTLAVLILDIDHFKKINDTWGHSSGDRVIQVTALTISRCIREQDMVGRIGGEEFVVLLPETELSGALAIAERVRMALQESSEATTDNSTTIHFTASIGVSLARETENFQDTLSRADQGLYQAKESGRNRVATA